MNEPDPRRAFRLEGASSLAFTGAGGKSSMLFWLGEVYGQDQRPVVLSTTTHLGVDQAGRAMRHLICRSSRALPSLDELTRPGSLLITGPAGERGRLGGLSSENMVALHAATRSAGVPLMIEADGSRRRSLKAPAPHEPAVPKFVETVAVFAGLAAIGHPLDAQSVHRPDLFAKAASTRKGVAITQEMIVRVLRAEEGGLKGVPSQSRPVAVLTQAATETQRGLGAQMALSLLKSYAAVIVCDLGSTRTHESTTEQPRLPRIHAVYEPVAAVILAAGGSRRFQGTPKQTLLWRGAPFVRHVVMTAVHAGLDPIIVVTGGDSTVAGAVEGLDVQLVHNAGWQRGQSSSLRVGVQQLADTSGAAVFLLADQPQITPSLVRAVVERHREQLSQVVAPMIDGQRGNPVLFDRSMFGELENVRGDQGGRALFSKAQVDWVPWHDPRMLLDVDTPEDYEKLIAAFA